MEFAASAPCKCILFGEHYVVYGAPALSAAIEPRNSAVFSDAPPGAGARLFSPFGEGRILPSGRYEGVKELGIFAAVARKIADGRAIPSCSVEFLSAWKLKGVGSSASLCAAFAAGMLRLCGKKHNGNLVFEAAQEGDLVAHGGRASGIDARTVSLGTPIVFRRSFQPPRFDFASVKFALPKNCSLLIIDTNLGKKDGTSKMLARFAAGFGIDGAPQDAGDGKREAVLSEYARVWAGIEDELRRPTAEGLGRLMDENHALLLRRKMSTEGIEAAVAEAKKAGAYGAKLTGGGGEGGAVLALFENSDVGGAKQRIAERTGFACYPARLSGKGACIDAE